MAKLMSKVIFVCKDKMFLDEDLEVYNSFPVNPDSPSMLETAKSWAKRGNEFDDSKIFEFENEKFEDVTINELEIRGEGGRAYKVIVVVGDKRFYVDLREDALLDTMLHFGIEKGGKLKGQYIFVQDGNSVKLTLIDSSLHKEAIEDSQVRSKEKIANKDLILGHGYKNLSGDHYIYIGNVFCKTFENIDGVLKEKKKLEQKMLFFNYYIYNEADSVEKQMKKLNLWQYELKTSHSLREDLGKLVDVDVDLDKIIALKIKEAKIAFDISAKEYSSSYLHSKNKAIMLSYLNQVFISTTKEFEEDDSRIRRYQSL